MVDHTHFLLGEDASNIVLVKWKKTNDIILIHTLNSNLACVVDNPKCPNIRKMIKILKGRGALVVSSDEVGHGDGVLRKTGRRPPEQRAPARKADESRRKRQPAA